MNNEELINCFRDTIEQAYSILREKTAQAIKSNQVYKEKFVSNVPKRNENSSIIVQAGTTFDAARQFCHLGKVAVLNFANPENPGGGVNFGAMAQEECLCRSSNLYHCISDENVFNDYYLYHRGLGNHFYTDRLIYTEGVTVFKDDSVIPQMLPENDWFEVDVITCAAPYIGRRKYTNWAALFQLFKNRIKNIFEAARDNAVDVIILGAFGCGAFKNPPLIVAEAFREIICEQDYLSCFKQIVFAIKPTGEKCENLHIFSRQFDFYAPDANERCCVLGETPSFRFYKVPRFFNEMNLSNSDEFRKWQGSNKYFGKQFSILGDSISTLAGYNPKGYKVFYNDENCTKTSIFTMSDTWWGNVIDFFGGELLVNNSWSGSRVTKLSNNKLFPSGCCDERTSGLHINNVSPDVIIVYLGANDWANGVLLENKEHKTHFDNEEYFDLAYSSMLNKLKKNYPKAEIWCCTLNSTFMSAQQSFVFPDVYNGSNIKHYNKIITRVAKNYHCKLIDLYSYKIPNDTIDGSHPNINGMKTLATLIIKSIAGSEVNKFMTFEDTKTSGFNVSDKVYIEYVNLPQDITRILFGEILRLFDNDLNQEIEIKNVKVKVGREDDCDLQIAATAVSHYHATFYFENSSWYIMDSNSKNGTWLNGKKLEQNKKYELACDDVIDFAHQKQYVIFKTKKSSNGIDEGSKAAAVLEGAARAFYESDNTDNTALKIIAVSMCQAPLFFPVEVDIEAMFGGIDPHSLKAGDVLSPSNDIKFRVLNMNIEGEEITPVFTSEEQAKKGPDVSITRFYPQDYLPMLLDSKKSIVINPFGGYPVSFKHRFISDIVFPVFKGDTAKKTIENMGVGTKINDKYELLSLIGQGGTFKVYLAKDLKLNMVWAVKVCHKSEIKHEVILQAAVQEVNMLKHLDHPAIPKIVDIIDDDNYFCVVEEYIKGETLEKVVNEFGAQPIDNVVQWGKQICDVLGYLHSLNPPYIYRDMKPANVILKPDGTIKLVDFGIMRKYDYNNDSDEMSLGTVGYASPEHYGGKGQTDPRSDIYTIGVTLHRLLTGYDPIKTPHDLPLICKIDPTLPKGIEYIVSKCTELDRDKRYQSCEQLKEDLDNYMNLPKPKGLFGRFFK